MSDDSTSGNSTSIGVHFVPHVRDDVVFRQLQDEWVVFDPTVEKIHVLNLTATLVWVHCDGETPIGDIAREVEQSFEEKADVERVLKDTLEAVKNFRSLGLLQ